MQVLPVSNLGCKNFEGKFRNSKTLSVLLENADSKTVTKFEEIVDLSSSNFWNSKNFSSTLFENSSKEIFILFSTFSNFSVVSRFLTINSEKSDNEFAI